MATQHTISVPVTLHRTLTLPDGMEPTAAQVALVVGKWVEVRNGTDFDSDDFEVIDTEPVEDSEIDTELLALDATPDNQPEAD